MTINSDLIPEGRLLNKCNVENIPELFFGELGQNFCSDNEAVGLSSASNLGNSIEVFSLSHQNVLRVTINFLVN